MIPILLVTHGPFAPSLIKTSEMLVGKSEKLEAITLEANDDVKLFQDKIREKLLELDEGDGVLTFVDLLGGSPYNAVASSLRENSECLTGLNLSMLLTALEARNYCNLEELKEECRNAAKVSVVSVREHLQGIVLDDEDDE